jgi:hypothetical protein
VVDLHEKTSHAAFLGRVNKARCDKGLRAPEQGYQQSYPQKIWTSGKSPAKSITCNPMCMKSTMQRMSPSTFFGPIRLLTAQLYTCVAQRRLARAPAVQCPGRALRHDKDH